MHRQRRNVSRLAAETLATAAALALLTWIGVRLGLRAEPAAVLYLGLILLVSLRGRLSVALFAAIAGTAAWDYFFSGEQIPLPQRQVRDIVTLVVFSATAIMITRLVTQLRTSEGRWKNVFDNNPTMYFMVDSSGTVLSVNPTGADQLGYRPDELIGQPVLNVFVEEDKPAARQHVERCLARLGESMSWELRKVRKSGAMLWVRETARAVQLGTDAPVVLIACEDITDQKAAQDKIRENEARVRGQASLLDLTHDAIFVRDFGSVIRYWNRGAEQLYGWSREEAVGRVTHELLGTEFPQPLDQIMATVLRTGRWDGELVHTKRDGTRIVMASRWSLQRDEQERPIGVLETNNDITVRKRAEEELRRSEGFLAQAQRLSLTGSFGWKTSDDTILWSDETYRIFGVHRSTPPTLELVLQLTHPEDRAAVRQTIERAQRDVQDFEHEYRLLLADGSVKHLHVVARAVRDDSERPEFVGAVMDVTASKRAAEALRTAQAELARASTLTTMGQFAASVAHELRQPLAALAMNGSATLRWLNREVPDLAEAREAAARIVREAQRADEVIRGLRALVAKSGLQREPLELNDAAHEVLELVRGELRRKDVAVQTELDPMLPSVLGDRVQLQQVLLNLIVNAMEAMAPIADRAKVVVVRTERAGPGEVAVAVEDTGPGLDPAAAGRIFDPFFTTKAHGLGMGLSICRSIVEAHGGELSASPRAAGGTRFRFTVPMSAPASTSTAADIQRARVEPSADGLATA